LGIENRKPKYFSRLFQPAATTQKKKKNPTGAGGAKRGA
jgi:hypothetical protein